MRAGVGVASACRSVVHCPRRATERIKFYPPCLPTASVELASHADRANFPAYRCRLATLSNWINASVAGIRPSQLSSLPVTQPHRHQAAPVHSASQPAPERP